MEIITTQKYIRTSPRKLREVVFMIKKLSPMQAIEILPHVEKKAAEIILKAIKTAVANASQKGAVDKLTFKEIQIGEGPMQKRIRAGARGRAKPYKRRMSHIRIVLEAEQKKTTKKVEETKKQVKKAAKKGSK